MHLYLHKASLVHFNSTHLSREICKAVCLLHPGKSLRFLSRTPQVRLQRTHFRAVCTLQNSAAVVLVSLKCQVMVIGSCSASSCCCKIDHISRITGTSLMCTCQAYLCISCAQAVFVCTRCHGSLFIVTCEARISQNLLFGKFLVSMKAIVLTCVRSDRLTRCLGALLVQ